MTEPIVLSRFSERSHPISFDPYIVWRTLVLANPDMLLFACEKRDMSHDPSIIDFTISIAVFPDDLQDLLFTFAQFHGVAAAHRALDQAVETAYRIEREAWLNSPSGQHPESEPAVESVAEPQPEYHAA